MKYAVIGAGGTGGMIGFYMTKAGKDVTLIARGEHLAKTQEKGLTVERMWDGFMETLPVSATDMEHYRERPACIFYMGTAQSLKTMTERFLFHQ